MPSQPACFHRLDEILGTLRSIESTRLDRLAAQVANAGEDALPATRSQERRWTRAIRTRLARWAHCQNLEASAARRSEFHLGHPILSPPAQSA